MHLPSQAVSVTDFANHNSVYVPHTARRNGHIGNASGEDSEEEEKPQLSVWMTVGLLVVVTVVRVTLIRDLSTIDGCFRSWSL